MRTQILLSVPDSVVTLKTDSIPNIISCSGRRGLRAFLIGVGTIDVYTYQEGVWRQHPQGQSITDDGSYVRLVLDNDIEFACVLSGDTDDDSKAYLQPVDF